MTSTPKKLILCSYLSPGDIVMMTAAVRELHAAEPNKYITDVRTSCPALWENNPYITPLSDEDAAAQRIACEYPLINQSNSAPYHSIHGYTDFLGRVLRLQLRSKLFKGDIYISPLEKSWHSQVREVVGSDMPFWIIVAGGKSDFTIKWWDVDRYQKVVDHFRGSILFVQVGAAEHHHPALRGVIDLRGKTDLRQLVRLVYNSQGVLCPVTSLMHLAAAIETREGMPRNRPCVVVAGGREPMHWEAYTHHQFLHTNGALPCCQQGGCWKSRVVPLGDGDSKDNPENLCSNRVQFPASTDLGRSTPDYSLPRCMDLITSDDVIRSIGVYFHGGAVRFLTDNEARSAELAAESS